METKDPTFDLATKLKADNCPGVSFPVIHMIARSAWKLATEQQESKIKELESELEGYRTGMTCAGGCR